MSINTPEDARPHDDAVVIGELIEHDELSQGERGMDRCPACDYSLIALPLDYRCPECAFEYDEYTRAWRVGRADFGMLRIGQTALLAAVAALVGMYGIKWILYRAKFPGGMGTQTLLNAMVVASCACLGSWRSERSASVAVGPGGVTFRIWPRRAFTLSWTELAEIPPEVAVERVFCRQAAGRIELVFRRHVCAILRKPAQRKDLYEAMHRARARFAAVEPKAPRAAKAS